MFPTFCIHADPRVSATIATSGLEWTSGWFWAHQGTGGHFSDAPKSLLCY